MKIKRAIKAILPPQKNWHQSEVGEAFAPATIALCKYWGKRDTELNLPYTASLSVSLGGKGARTIISLAISHEHQIELNGQSVSLDSKFAARVIRFLNLISPKDSMYFRVETFSNVPVGAGLASSASGFAALVLAANEFFSWQLDEKKLSILARLCSGSASRSIWNHAFVKWHAGKDKFGADSFAEPIKDTWPELRVGLLIVSDQEKAIGSREAMERTVQTSRFYQAWVEAAPSDILAMEKAIKEKDFQLLGETAESNALSMHATMLAAKPPVAYFHPGTVMLMQKIWQLRALGLPVYFTEDAGPNLKLLFLKENESEVKKQFSQIEVIAPFEEQVVLVDDQDQAIGLMEKQEAHEKGALHRAFSVFIVRENSDGYEILLQKRAQSKYHCGGLWTNACCSHPRTGETILNAAKRRLYEELGLRNIKLKEIGRFHYVAEFQNGLTENEIDHVLLAYDNGQAPICNKHEVEEFKWIAVNQLKTLIKDRPNEFTPWLLPALDVLAACLIL